MIKTMLLEECVSDKEVNNNGLDFFVSTIELSNDFKIIASESHDDGDLLIVKDLEKADGEFGVYLEISVNEIMKIENFDDAVEFLRVMRGDRESIVLEGVTRIVGYYSRVNNWNSSKIGELRDRGKGMYGVSDSLGKSGSRGRNTLLNSLSSLV